MCGIVGYAGSRSAVDVLIGGLKRLEYRGYDSAGIAVVNNGRIEIQKSEGKLANVEKLVHAIAEDKRKSYRCGIGHTRWATHGKPTTQNAHPHRTGHVVLVHNGIIENYQEIKKEIMSKGHKPASETDSELFGFLVLDAMEGGMGLAEAVRTSFLRLHGSCTVVVMSEKEPGTFIAVRNGTPLVAAWDTEGGSIVASDAQPIIDYTRDVYFLEDGEMAVGNDKAIKFYAIKDGKPVDRLATKVDWSVEKLDKQGYDHYMLKEIHEQPVTVVDTMNEMLDRVKTDPFPLAARPGVDLLNQATDLTLIACGTSHYATMLGKYWLERFARIPVATELASEYRYRDPVTNKGSLVVGVSQSGETADTLAVLKMMKKKGVKTLSLTNVRGSTMSREADANFYTSAGPEIGVASTKAFTAQMLSMLLWAGHLGMKQKSVEATELKRLFDDVIRLPHLLNEELTADGPLVKNVKKAAEAVQRSKGFFFMGRGYSYPIALEGALKLKEIAYVHAEGYAAGELKHGPIAMLDESMTVIVLAPQDRWREKSVSNLEEVRARGARIVGVGSQGDTEMQRLSDCWIPVNTAGLDEGLFPFLLTPVVQLFSYSLATLKGTDVDKPRNLAKSVTVE
jgi:glucosamine--fructose-6-phosphate aminotransferase (isomerizing)